MLGKFSDGELKTQIGENVRGKKVFIVGVTNPPGDNLLQMAFVADAAHRSSAGEIIAMPVYLGYNRQDRKDKPRVPVSSHVVARILEMDCNKIVLFDPHSEVTAAFFRGITTDVLFTSYASVPFLKKRLSACSENIVVVSPDAGGAKRAQSYSKLLGLGGVYAMISKGERPADNQVGNDLKVIGDVAGKDVLIVDDIMDTCGTICKSSKALVDSGAKKVYVYAPFGLFSGNAIAKLDAMHEIIPEVFTTDIIHHSSLEPQTQNIKLTVLPFAPFLAEVIRRVANNESLTALFLK